MRVKVEQPTKVCKYCNKVFTKDVDLSYKLWASRFLCSKICRTNYLTGRTHKIHKLSISVYDRLMRYIDKNNSTGCWEWLGALSSRGYAKINVRDNNKLASRVMWSEINGKIPEGLFVCHSCDNPKCINPNHLWLGTAYDNVMDMYKKGRHKINVNR